MSRRRVRERAEPARFKDAADGNDNKRTRGKTRGNIRAGSIKPTNGTPLSDGDSSGIVKRSSRLFMAAEEINQASGDKSSDNGAERTNATLSFYTRQLRLTSRRIGIRLRPRRGIGKAGKPKDNKCGVVCLAGRTDSLLTELRQTRREAALPLNREQVGPRISRHAADNRRNVIATERKSDVSE